MVGRKEHRVCAAMQIVSVRMAFQLFTELAHKVRKVDKADARTAPQMIVNLSYSSYAQAGILEGILTSSDWALRAWTRSRPTTEVRLFFTRWLISRVNNA